MDVHIYLTIGISVLIIYTTILLATRFDKFSITHGPEILTTLGILGCFAGVSYSLWHLNTDASELAQSIPSLLGGMKTAFIGSLVGILGALVIRLIHYFKRNSISEADGSSENSNDALVKAIKDLQSSLVGSEEGSLLTQVKLQRQESNDHFSKLRESFDEFASHMVENNQKAIIEALERVIKDFNEKLTEQFGENFKQLNSAVSALVVWQEQYKNELSLLKTTQEETASDMKKASEAFAELVNRASEFEGVANKLKDLMETLDKQKDVLFVQEKALSELITSMKDVTPDFTNKMNRLITELNESLGSIQGQIADNVKNFGVQAQTSNAEMKELLTNTIQSTQTTLLDNLKENSSIIKEGVVNLDKALQNELNNSLKSLGDQLAALSEKFVKDYQPLTERLREVIRIAESGNK